jgi:hypothetical protein
VTKLLQWGNSKLDFPVFNIPATKEICGRVCPGCYSHKAYRIFPGVLEAQQKRYEATLQLDFVSRIRKELKSFRRPFKYVRIHASAGEFYNFSYILKWHAIISSFPDITFYAYTKRKRDFDFSSIESLPNAVIIDSLYFGRINYGPVEKAPAGAYICPDVRGSDTKCGSDCNYCQVKGQADDHGVWFVKH